MTNTPNPTPDRSRATTRKRLAVVAGVIAAAIAAAVGAPVATAALRGDVSATSAPRIVRVETATDLGGLTIDELAGELAEAGLQLEITPAQASPGASCERARTQ